MNETKSTMAAPRYLELVIKQLNKAINNTKDDIEKLSATADTATEKEKKNIEKLIDKFNQYQSLLTSAKKSKRRVSEDDDTAQLVEQYSSAMSEIENYIKKVHTAAGHVSEYTVNVKEAVRESQNFKDALKELNSETPQTILNEDTLAAVESVASSPLVKNLTEKAKALESALEGEDAAINKTTDSLNKQVDVESKAAESKKRHTKATTESTEEYKKATDAYQKFKSVQEVVLSDIGSKNEGLFASNPELKKQFDDLSESLKHITNDAEKMKYSLNLRDLKENISQANKEIGTLGRSKENLIKQLDDWAVKNEKILSQDEELRKHFEAVRSNASQAFAPEYVDVVNLQFSILKERGKEAGQVLKSSFNDASSSAYALASSVAATAALIETKIVDGIYRLAVNAIKNIINEVKTLDAELVEIRKVTSFTESELTLFVQKIREVGNATATTTSDLLEASAAFARSGYTKEQIVQLTEEAAILKNVSDNIEDMSKSAEILISVMKAYNIPASEARTITDQLNNISNNAAISFDDLAEGIQRVGAVFATTGTTIGELSAMLTGANEVLQNIEKTSTGLSTISERIRGVKGATEDGIGTAKLEEMMSIITSRYGEAVHIIDQSNGQLRSTYDILSDLAQIWDKLSANERQELGEKIAGKRQITVLNALLQNWESVEVAISNVEGAAGSALREQSAYINSLTGAINQFQASLQNMYQGAMDSGLLTIFVKIGTVLVNGIDKLGVWSLALGALAIKATSLFNTFGRGAKVLKGIQQIQEVLQRTDNARGILLGTRIKNLKTALNGINEEYREYAKLLVLDEKRLTTYAERNRLLQLKKLYEDQDIAQVTEAVALEQTRNSLIEIRNGLFTAGISILISFIPTILGWFNASLTVVSDINSKIEETESQIKSIKQNIEDINNSIEQNNGLVTQEQLNLLKQYNVELGVANHELKVQNEQLAEQMKKRVVTGQDSSGGELSVLTYYDKALKKSISSSTKDLYNMIGDAEELTKETYDVLLEYISEHKSLMNIMLSLDDDLLDENTTAIKDMFENIIDLTNDYAEEMNANLTQAFTEESFLAKFEHFFSEGFSGDNLKDLKSAVWLMSSFGMSIEEATEYLAKLNTKTIETFAAQEGAIEPIVRELKDYVTLYDQATNGIGAKNLVDIVQHWSEYADVLKIENGELVISKNLVVEKAKDVVKGKIKELDARKTTLEAQISELKTERLLLIASDASATATVGASKVIIDALNRQRQAADQRNKALAGATDTKDVSKALDTTTRIKDIDAAIATAEKELANVNKQIAYLEKLNVEKMLKAATEATKKAGKSTKSATKETKKANEELTKLQALLKALQDQLSKTSDVYKKVQEEMKKLVEEEKDGLEDANDVLDENIKYYEARIKLVEEALKSEIEGLKAQKKAAEDANKAQQDAIEDRIKALKEETKLYEKNNKAEQEAIDAQVDALEEQIKAIDEAAKAQEDALSVQEKLLEIEKARLALEKAKDAYEQAKNNKTVRTYDAELGWIYTADQSAVNAAYGEYQGAQKNLDDLLKEYADMMAENERESQKAAIQAQIDELKAQKETLKDLLEQVKEDAEQQEEALKSEKELLEEQKEQISDSFQQQIDALDAQNDSLDNISDNVEKAVDKYLSDTEVQDWFARYMAASEEERVEMMNALEDIWRTDAETQRANEEEIDRLDTLLDEIDKMLEVQDYSISASEGVKEWLDTFKQVTYEDRRAMVSEMHDAYQEFYTEQSAQIAKVQEAIDNIEGNINITTQLLQHWGTGEYNTPVNNYANGGVVDSGLLHHTGMLSDNVKVHGNPASPELILNGKQQANLLYRLAKQAPSSTTINNANGAGSIYVATLNIQADSQDTLHGLLLQAKQLATVS